jgi:hypothetical protein
MCSDVQGSSCGRPRIHIRSRLRQQPHTDLPSRWNIPSGFRMLGIRGWGVQRIGRDRCNVQWQYSSMRQREPPNSSFLNTPAGMRFVRFNKILCSPKLKWLSHFKTFFVLPSLFLKHILSKHFQLHLTMFAFFWFVFNFVPLPVSKFDKNRRH